VRFTEGQRVRTDYGLGYVVESSARRVYIKLDEGSTINVQTGTPGYDRIEAVEAS
jgi:hypothetical protein